MLYMQILNYQALKLTLTITLILLRKQLTCHVLISCTNWCVNVLRISTLKTVFISPSIITASERAPYVNWFLHYGMSTND